MTEYIKQKRIILRDTRGNYSLGIRLPTFEYKPKNKKQNAHRKQYLEEYMARPEVKKHRREYQKDWRARNPEKAREILRRSYYNRNKKRKQLVNKRSN